jgi:hypothetical protein
MFVQVPSTFPSLARTRHTPPPTSLAIHRSTPSDEAGVKTYCSCSEINIVVRSGSPPLIQGPLVLPRFNAES